VILFPAVSFDIEPNLAFAALIMGLRSTQNSLIDAVDGRFSNVSSEFVLE
jgi:hypothetical protein